MTLITDNDTIKHYKQLKIELWTYLDGFSKGHLRNKMKGFFKHLETLLFGKMISIADDTFL